MSSIAIFFICAVVFLAIGVPVAATLGLSSILFIIIESIPVSTVIQRFFAGMDIVALLCIPFFILAGDLMAKGGIARRIVLVCNLLVGNITGGLAYVTIVVCAVFAAMTGSAMACCITIGAIMLPHMLEAGYSREFSTAIFSSGAVLGPIIPPSIAMIIYAVNTGTSISDLYRLGVPAGIILALGLCAVAFFLCKKRGLKGLPKTTGINLKDGEKLTSKKVIITIVQAIPALGSPIIILGAIFGGICTPTEAAVVAVLYSLVVGIFVYREIKIKEIISIFLGAAKGTAKIMYIVATASLFAWVISYARVPQLVLNSLLGISTNPNVLMLIMMLVLIAMGCVMDATPILLITIPIFLPVVQGVGINVLHFGIAMCVAVCVGFVTPPFGTCLFTGMEIGGVTMQKLVREIMPFVIVMIVMLFVIAFFPQLTMFVL